MLHSRLILVRLFLRIQIYREIKVFLAIISQPRRSKITLRQLFLHHRCGQYHRQQAVQRVLSKTRMEHHCGVIAICRYSQVMDRQHQPGHFQNCWNRQVIQRHGSQQAKKCHFSHASYKIKIRGNQHSRKCLPGRMLKGGSRRIRLQPFQQPLSSLNRDKCRDCVNF